MAARNRKKGWIWSKRTDAPVQCEGTDEGGNKLYLDFAIDGYRWHDARKICETERACYNHRINRLNSEIKDLEIQRNKVQAEMLGRGL